MSLTASLNTTASVNDQVKGTMISFSSGGCAIRTSAHLDEGQRCSLSIALARDGTHHDLFQIACEVVWMRKEFRIDTFYVYGLRFLNPLSPEQVAKILREERISANIPAKHASPEENKVVA